MLSKGVVASGVGHHVSCGESHDHKYDHFNNEISRFRFSGLIQSTSNLIFLPQSLKSMNFIQEA